MNRTQLEHIIRAASRISGDPEIVVIGSQAVHAQEIKLPAIAYLSEDADVYPRNHPEQHEDDDIEDLCRQRCFGPPPRAPIAAHARGASSFSERTEAQRVGRQVGTDRLAGRRAQLQAELLQQIVPFIPIEFIDIEQELWPPLDPHHVLDLRG